MAKLAHAPRTYGQSALYYSSAVCVWFIAATFFNFACKRVLEDRQDRPFLAGNIAGLTQPAVVMCVAFLANYMLGRVLEMVWWRSSECGKFEPSVVCALGTIGPLAMLLALRSAPVLVVHSIKCIEPLLVVVWTSIIERRCALSVRQSLPFAATITGVCMLTFNEKQHWPGSLHHGEEGTGADAFIDVGLVYACVSALALSMRNVALKLGSTKFDERMNHRYEKISTSACSDLPTSVMQQAHSSVLIDRGVAKKVGGSVSEDGDMKTLKGGEESDDNSSIESGTGSLGREDWLNNIHLSSSAAMRERLMTMSLTGMLALAPIATALAFAFPLELRMLILDSEGRTGVLKVAIWYGIYNFASLIVLSETSAVAHSLLNVSKRAFIFISALLFSGALANSPANAGCILALAGAASFTLLTDNNEQSGARHGVQAVRFRTAMCVLLTGGVASMLIMLRAWPFSTWRMFSAERETGSHHTNLTTRESITMYCWCRQDNFGDELSKFIVGRMGCANVDFVKPTAKGNYLGIGFLLHFSGQDDVVWGSGMLDEQHRVTNASSLGHNLRIRAVRGKLTASELKQRGFKKVPRVYGDPAMLINFFYSPKPFRGWGTVRMPLLVAHHNDARNFKKRYEGQIRVLSAAVPERYGGWRLAVDAIASASTVYSTSLHGIIIAEAYGVPAFHVQANKRKVDNVTSYSDFKDYYSATGRDDQIVDLDAVLANPGVLPRWIPPTFDPWPFIESFPFTSCFAQNRIDNQANAWIRRATGSMQLGDGGQRVEHPHTSNDRHEKAISTVKHQQHQQQMRVSKLPFNESVGPTTTLPIRRSDDQLIVVSRASYAGRDMSYDNHKNFDHNVQVDDDDVHLYCWCSRGNFGDDISAFLVRKLWCGSDQHVKVVPKSHSGKLLAVGSILHEAKPGDVVWGSGVNPKKAAQMRMVGEDDVEESSPEHVSVNEVAGGGGLVDFRAIRGRRTREVLMSLGYSNIPDVYGDPALLLPIVYRPRTLFNESKPAAPLLVAHKDDFKNFQDRYGGVIEVVSAVQRGRPREPGRELWMDLVDVIACASVVFSSSLHGVIIAEAYGVPAYHVSGKEFAENKGFNKFDDYFSASGRSDYVVDLDRVLRLGRDHITGTGVAAHLSLPPWSRPQHDIEGMLVSFPLNGCLEARGVDGVPLHERENVLAISRPDEARAVIVSTVFGDGSFGKGQLPFRVPAEAVDAAIVLGTSLRSAKAKLGLEFAMLLLVGRANETASGYRLPASQVLSTEDAALLIACGWQIEYVSIIGSPWGQDHCKTFCETYTKLHAWRVDASVALLLDVDTMLSDSRAALDGIVELLRVFGNSTHEDKISAVVAGRPEAPSYIDSGVVRLHPRLATFQDMLHQMGRIDGPMRRNRPAFEYGEQAFIQSYFTSKGAIEELDPKYNCNMQGWANDTSWQRLAHECVFFHFATRKYKPWAENTNVPHALLEKWRLARKNAMDDQGQKTIQAV